MIPLHHAVRKTAAIKKLLSCCLLLATLFASAQQKTVTGTVTSTEDGTPLPRVTIQVKGTSIGTATNEKGTYSIAVSPGQVLVASAIGFVTDEQKPGAKTTLDFVLKSTTTEMQNVVVTALGIKRDAKALGYATTTVKGEELTNAISGNWTDALSGKVAGLNMIRSNSGPTGSNKIILRGENNLTGDNEALIVVDGVVINQGSGRSTEIKGEAVYGTGSDNMPVDYGTGLNDINPEDIESITVLKGPGAAALYGARGANGAIMITTKSGARKKQKGLGATFNSNYSFEDVNRWPDLQYEYGQGLGGSAYYSFGAGPDGASTSATSSAYGPRFEGQSFYQYDPVTQKQGTVRTPWVPYPNMSEDFFDAGHTLTNSITIDGGTDKTTARFSVTNVNNTWIVPNTGYKRNTIALSVNSKVSDKLQIAAKINYTNKWSDNLPGAGYGNQSLMYWYIFWQPNADVNWLKNYWKLGQEQRAIQYPFSSFPENPYAVVHEFLNKTNRNGVTGNLQATYNFTPDLSLSLRTSTDLSYDQRSQQRPYDAGTKFPRGSYRTQNIFSQESTGDFLLRYSRKIKEKFNLSATLGGSALINTYNKDEVRTDSLVYPGLYSLSNNAGPLVTIPRKTKFLTNSVYGLLSASYKDYLFLDLTARQDWTSTLATPYRKKDLGFFYPSASTSLILSDLVKLPSQIAFAKFRFSVASVGSGGTMPYLTAYNYQSAGSLYNGGLENPSILANPDLNPLRTTTYEAGFNVIMFKKRLDFDVAVYTGNTKNQILNRIIDRASGYASAVINIGKINNKGIELALNGTPITTRNGFKWNAGIVFAANANEIKELADSAVVLRTGPVGGGQIVAKVGGSMGDLYGIGYLRAPDGQVVYDAATGFALLDPGVKYLGNTIPKWKMSFSNDFTFKQFRLSFLFDGQYGAVAHSLSHYKLAEQGKLGKTLPGRYNGIIGKGVVMGTDGKYYSNTTIATDIDGYYRSHMGADNAEGSTFSTDFIKFREARLDYSLHPRICKKLGLQKAIIGVYGRNLFIWTDWPIFDPEFGTMTPTAAGGVDIVQGFEIGQFPSTRTIGINLVVGF